MKKLIIAFSATLFLFANTVNAQQKIGHVNSDAIFASFPEVKTATSTAETFAKTKQAEGEKMVNEFQTKLKAAKEKQKTMNAKNKEALTKELTATETELKGLESKIEAYRTQSAKEISGKQNELFAPIQKKVSDAISAVAKEKGLTYVFESSKSQANNAIIYSGGGEDITASVKNKLGIK